MIIACEYATQNETAVENLKAGDIFTYKDEEYQPRMCISFGFDRPKAVILQSGVVHELRFNSDRVIKQTDVKLTGTIMR